MWEEAQGWGMNTKQLGIISHSSFTVEQLENTDK